MAFAKLLIYLLLSLSVPPSTANSIHGCGGFVEASSMLVKSRRPSDPKLDYSHITVELQTVDGLVKDSTNCAPNGYYFIPVYDKGSFIVNVKGPDGWSWEPDMVLVTVDESGCNSNTDINFQFTGFMVSGKVLGAVGGNSCPVKDGGPSDVKVELLTMSDNVIVSALTSEVGHYSFANIIPGAYKLRATHPNLGVEIRSSSNVNLGFGNTLLDDIFFVSGYDLHGYIVSQGNPILGVHVYLFSDDVSKVYCPQGVGNAPCQKKALCHSISDSDGKFIFNSLPCGVYDLLPYYKGENTEFDVSPSSMTITVEHHHVTIFQKFQVTGFSIGGRVTDGNGGRVNGASIIVNGQQKATTDNDGLYRLDQVTSKHYTIMAKKDHYKFSTLDNFLVLPSMSSIDDIKATYFDVCGVVRMISQNTVAKVALTHGPESVKTQTKLTNENGSFCFLVPPGEYQLSALAKNSNSSSSSLFAPSYINIIVNTPLLDLEFFEAQVNIHGTVHCKEKCSPSVSVSLARLVGESEYERKMITLNNVDGDFIFPMIFPGKYILMVKHASSTTTDEDSWCWERDSIYLDVGTRDVVGVVFVQKGYWISIMSTHDTEVQIEQPDSSRIDLNITKGSQRICIQNPAEHELHFRNSCVFFGGPSMKFDTRNLTPIYVTGTKYHLKGEIHIDASLLQDVQDQSGLIFVDIFIRGDVLADTVTARLLIKCDPRGTSVFEYSFMSNLGQEVVFAPRYSSAIQGKMILFYPRRRHVSVTSDGCQAAVPVFVGRMGLYAEGSVSPPLDGVSIKIIAAGYSIHSHLHTGDLALVTETGADGSFSAGPLFDDIHYNVEAFKPGYFVKQVGPYSFTCQKLGQILVNVHDCGETVGLFPSVLFSLSGEDGYRNNSVSGAGGAFIFENLFPGSFYLRPFLKEYSFSPAALAIELESGDSKEALFLAKRIAYSVLGNATLLSGQPKEGIYVEARSESKGFYEEAITDGAGNFCLRGLLPDTTYRIKLVTKEEPGLGSSNEPGLGSSKIERSSPDHLTVKVGTEDMTGVEFVVFEVSEMTILSGHVEGQDLEMLQPHLSIEIRSARDPSEVESVFPLPFSYYFEIRDLAKGRHLVQLQPGVGWKSGRLESEVLDIDLSRQPQVHVGPLRYKVIEHHHKQELTAAPVFPLLIGLCAIVLFISLPRLKDSYQTAVERTQLGSSFPTGKKEIRKQVFRKRAN